MSTDGVWNGYFTYDRSAVGNEDCRFTANLSIVVWEIVGTCVDHREPVKDIPFRPAFQAIKESMTPKQVAQHEKLLQRYPDLVVRIELPREAEIYGDRLHFRIRFVKTYSGPHKVTWIIGGREIVVLRRRKHRIWYEGEMSKDERIIEGKWRIRRWGFFGRWLKPHTSGAFRMERTS